MNPLWILAAMFGALTMKNPFGGGAPQQQVGGSPFDPNLPPEIAAGVIGCAAKCADPQQMLGFAAELAKQQFPVAAIYLQTRAAMLIQARQAQQQLPLPGVPAQASATVAAPLPTPSVPQAVKHIQRTLSPEQNAKFEEFLAQEQGKGLSNGSAPKTEAPSERKVVVTKERAV